MAVNKHGKRSLEYTGKQRWTTVEDTEHRQGSSTMTEYKESLMRDQYLKYNEDQVKVRAAGVELHEGKKHYGS